MECCGSKDVPVVIEKVDDSWTTAPQRKRRCTDVLFLLLFAAALAGVGYVAFRAVQIGDPGRYIHGYDSWGNVCGRKNNLPIKIGDASSEPRSNVGRNVTNSGKDLSNYTYVLNLNLSDVSFWNPTRLLSSKAPAIALCVTHCPHTTTSCPDFLTTSGYDVSNDIVNRRICHMKGKVILPQKPVLNRCVPKQLVAANKEYVETSLLAILTASWLSILYLLLIALGLSLFTIVMLQLFTRVLVITILVLSVLGTGAVTAYLWYEYSVSSGITSRNATRDFLLNMSSIAEGILGDQEKIATDIVSAAENFSESIPIIREQSSETKFAIATATTVFTMICWTILIWTRKSLKLVITLFDEASFALFSMPTLLLEPVKTAIVLVGTFSGFVVISAFLMSDQEPKVDVDEIVSFVDKPITESGKILFILIVFMFLWISQFVIACQQIILAGAVSNWFFTRGNRERKCFCNVWAVIQPTLDLIFYNLGTAAFGSLIIAILQFIRVVLAYIQSKLKHSNNKAAKFCLTCLQCCLACFEKFLKYINRNAYIIVAMYGEGFCASAKKAISLLVSNAQHVMALNCISGFCLLLAKVTVVTLIGVIGSEWFKSASVRDLKFILPMIISCLGAFYIASCFMSVYGMAIDTIFLCYCDDHQRNNGDDRPYYSSKNLQRFMDKAKNRNLRVEQQPDSSAGPPNSGSHYSNRELQQKPKTRNGRSSTSFTRINIPDRDRYTRSFKRGITKVHPIPEVSEP